MSELSAVDIIILQTEIKRDLAQDELERAHERIRRLVYRCEDLTKTLTKLRAANDIQKYGWKDKDDNSTHPLMDD